MNKGVIPALLIIGIFGLSYFSNVAHALEYSTFIGNNDIDHAHCVAIGESGNVIVAGYTWDDTFPTTSDVFDQTYNGSKDIFVAVFSSDLSSLLYSTLVGGTEIDSPFSVLVDQSNNILVGGYTDSEDFPTTSGAFDPTHNNSTGLHPMDGIVILLSPQLDSLISSTYLGGNDSDDVRAMTFNSEGNVIVSGMTSSGDFPVTSGVFDTYKDATPLYISILSNNLSTLIASTYVEGTNGNHEVHEIVEESDGNFIVTAHTNSTDFPTSPDAYDDTMHGRTDIIVFRITPDLSDLLHATYIGGIRWDHAAGLAIDSDGSVIVLGDSESPDFPTTLGSYDPTFNDHPVYSYPDFVLFKFSHDLSTLLCSTFIGSSNSSDHSRALGLLGSGRIVVTGNSFNAGFPVTPDAFDTSFNGFDDVVLAVLSNDLSELHYSTFVGGGGLDCPKGVVVNHPTGCYVTGYADPGFPTTEGAFDRGNNFVDGFVMKFVFPDDVHPGVVTGPGPGDGNRPLVRTSESEWQAYGVSTYGVNVACGDLDGNGYDEIITGPGPGAVFGPHVRGWSSNGTAMLDVNFLAYGTNKYGVNVAAGDIDGDGMDEILTGAGPGAVFGPHVRGWNVDGGEAAPIPDISYFAYGTLKWGVNVTAGDIDGDGYEEIVTGAGPGAVFGPHVRGWDYDGDGPLAAIQAVSYFAYGTLKYGVNVACGDLDGDGFDEIITGPGPGAIFGPHVRGWNYDGDTLAPMATVNFFAYSEGVYGAVVSAFDVDGDGIDEILTMPGSDPTQPAHARAWNVDGGDVTAIEDIDFYPYSDEMLYGGKIAGGLFVTESNR